MTENFLDNPEPPTWDELRGDRCLVEDTPHQKIGAYAGGYDCVVLMSQSDDDAAQQLCIDVERVPALMEALSRAMIDAVLHRAEQDAAMAKHYAGGGGD